MSTPSTSRRRKSSRAQKYKPDVVRAAFAPWADGPATDDGEQRMYCPLCEEPGVSASPSASMNAEEGVWNCLKTDGHGGPITELVAQLKRETGFNIRSVASPSGVRLSSLKKTSAPDPLEDQEKPYHWHDQMMRSFSERLEYLTEQRGLSEETIQQFKIGWDGQRYTIPVRVRGKWINVRRYLPNATGDQQKMLNLKGHGTATLAFSELLQGNNLPVLLCEGEWDALLAEQESEGRYVAVTGTGGSGTPPSDLSMLAQREVFIAYDCDDAGREGAEKVAARLRVVGAQVHVLDLTRLGLPSTKNQGADISDLFRKWGGTAGKIAEEFHRLRDDDPSDHDDVLRAIETLFMVQEDVRSSLVDDVRSDDDVADMPTARYVVDGWLPVGFFSDFFGEPGSKKTFAILDMLMHIRAGEPWHGHDVEQGATLLFEGEGLEQLKARIEAWKEFNENPDLAPGGWLSEPVDMTSPEGVARVARTVRQWETRHRTRVVCVGFDPLVEYMLGEENGEGMELVTRGLRALARYLDIAVVVGAHTNASGERARGGDHLRMRSGAHVKVESLKHGRMGLVQEKQKNGERLALQLLPTPVVNSLVLLQYARQTASEYYAAKFSDDSEERAATKLVLSEQTAAVKNSKGDTLLLDCVRENPGIGKGKLVNACAGNGVGKPALEARIDALCAQGLLRFERDGTGVKAPMRFFLADPVPAESADAEEADE